jgi:hypothetical protein
MEEGRRNRRQEGGREGGTNGESSAAWLSAGAKVCVCVSFVFGMATSVISSIQHERNIEYPRQRAHVSVRGGGWGGCL